MSSIDRYKSEERNTFLICLFFEENKFGDASPKDNERRFMQRLTVWDKEKMNRQVMNKGGLCSVKKRQIRNLQLKVVEDT